MGGELNRRLWGKKRIGGKGQRAEGVEMETWLGRKLEGDEIDARKGEGSIKVGKRRENKE